MNLIRSGALALGFIGSAGGVWAQTPAQLAALEKAIEDRRKVRGVPGIAVLVVSGEKVVLLKGFGVRDLSSKKPVTANTLFAIGSTTKAFTAAAVLSAVDEGKVSLSDPPRKFLPYFKMREKESDEKITVRDLLRHTSGLTRTDLMMVAADGRLNRQEIIEAACSARPTEKLGEKWQYQNVMFSAAGEIAGRALGDSYEGVVARRFFGPLGMKRANFSVKATLADPDHARGYNLDPVSRATTPMAMRSIEATAAAGAINASARDLVGWVRLWLDGGRFGGRQLLSARSVADATTQQIEMPGGGYGYGWMLNQWHGQKVVEHGGNIDGFNAHIAMLPGKKLGVAVLTNVFVSPCAEEVSRLVFQHLSGVPEPKGKPAGAATNPAAEVGTYRSESVPVPFIIEESGGRLTVTRAAGAPKIALIPLGGRRYKLGPPAPDGITFEFKPDKGDAKKTVLELMQGGQAMIFTRTEPLQKPDITVDDLLHKMIDGAGGVANLKKHKSSQAYLFVDYENQGLTGSGKTWAERPNRFASRVNLTAARKSVGWIGEWFDGVRGGQGASFTAIEALDADAVKRLAIANDFYENLLDFKKHFEKIELVGVVTIGEERHGIGPEECYRLEVVARGVGDTMTLYVSTSTFLVIRRDSIMGQGAVRVPVTVWRSDFRDIDGVQVPFMTLIQTPNIGDVVQRVERFAFDVPVEPGVFAGPRK